MWFKTLNISQRHTFLEYIFGGTEISLNLGIDFTKSNGDPNDSSSLHYFDPALNEYIQAISQVGTVLQYYDTNKLIPTFGFGGIVPPMTERASHCFAINGDIFDPECNGIDGVIEAYQNSLQKVELYGPTYFSKILKLVVDQAYAEKGS